MAIKKNYTSELEVEKFLNTTIVAGAVDDIINGAIDIVDMWTGRNFVADTVASAKRYSGNGGQNLPIDDCIDVTKVERGYDSYGDNFTEIVSGGSSGYYLLPENNVKDGGGKYPIQKLHLRSNTWLSGVKNCRITAKWGFSAVCPDDVRVATTIIAGGIYNFNRASGSGDISSEKIGNYSVSYDVSTGGGNWGDYRRALKILNSYRRFNL